MKKERGEQVLLAVAGVCVIAGQGNDYLDDMCMSFRRVLRTLTTRRTKVE